MSNDDVSVKRFGHHWKKLGFISRDPIKSLIQNNVGIFGLIQIFAFLFFHKELVFKLYDMSLTYKFPLCELLIKCSKVIIDYMFFG